MAVGLKKSMGPMDPHGPPLGPGPMVPGPGAVLFAIGGRSQQNSFWEKVMCVMVKSGVFMTFAKGIGNQGFSNQPS
jgi:hypothetical protein